MKLPKQQIRSLRIMMSYFAVATAETVATILTSCIPQTKTGPAILEIYDISENFYFKDNVIVEYKSAIPLIKNKYKRKEWVVVFPDDEAVKRYGDYFSNYTKIVCSKERVGNTRTIKDYIGPDIGNKLQFIIVNDVVQTGDTLLECARMLKQSYKDTIIHAFVTHAVFPNHSYRKFMTDNCPIDTFLCTNSNPVISDILIKIPQFQVIPLVPYCSQPKIYVASCNYSKLQAVSDGRKFMYRVIGIDVPSGVEEQPIGCRVYDGCRNRLMSLSSETRLKYGATKSDIYFSLENGIILEGDSGEDICVVIWFFQF